MKFSFKPSILTGKFKNTSAGVLATIMWSTIPVLVKFIDNSVPFFQFVSIAFLSSALAYLIFNMFEKSNLNNFREIPLEYIVMSVIGVFGNYVCLFIALDTGNTALNLMIYSTWPIMMLFMNNIMFSKPIYYYHIIGALICITGIAFINLDGIDNQATDRIEGALFALLGGFLWAMFSATTKKYNEMPRFSVCFVMIGCALSSLACHFIFEEGLRIEYSQLALIICLGSIPMGIGFILWDKGLKGGNIQIISGLCYIKPLLSFFLLIVFGFSHINLHILLGFVMIGLGSIVASSQDIKKALKENTKKVIAKKNSGSKLATPKYG